MKLAIKLATAFYTMQTLAMLNVIQRAVYGEWDGQGGNKIGQLANLAFIAVSVFLFSRALPRVKSYRTSAFLALGICALLLLSMLWSVDRGATLRSGVTYLAMVIGAIGIAGTLECDEYMMIVAGMVGICAIASAGLLVVAPHLAMGGGGGSFDVRGIVPHKNVLGQDMAAGVLASLHGLQTGKRRRPQDLAILALFLGLTLLSKSATSLLMIVFYATVHLLLFLYRKGAQFRLAAHGLSAVAVLTGCLILFLPDLLLELLGKDPTLTGRAELWAYVWQDIDLRPILGWGYMAFWSTSNPAALDISSALKWFVPQAHNGVLEILLNVGYGGATLFAYALVWQLWQSWTGLRTSARTVAITSLVCCGGIIVLGVSEEVLIAPYQVSTSMFFITGMMCGRALLKARTSLRAPQNLRPAMAAATRAP